MFRMVARESLIARAMPRRSPFTRVTPALSIAMSVPVPMAMPTSAWARVGARRDAAHLAVDGEEHDRLRARAPAVRLAVPAAGIDARLREEGAAADEDLLSVHHRGDAQAVDGLEFPCRRRRGAARLRALDDRGGDRMLRGLPAARDARQRLGLRNPFAEKVGERPPAERQGPGLVLHQPIDLAH